MHVIEPKSSEWKACSDFHIKIKDKKQKNLPRALTTYNVTYFLENIR